MKNRLLKLFLLILLPLLMISSSSSDDKLSEKVEYAVRQYIIGKNPDWAKLKMEIQFGLNRKVSERLASYGDKVKLEVPEIYPNSKITGGMILPLQVLEDGVERERIFIRTSIKVFKDIVVAKKNLKKGTAVKTGDVELKECDILEVRGDYFSQAASLSNKEAESYIPAGTVVTINMIRQIPVVAKNEKVKILVKDSGIRVEAEGVAQEDGMIGDSIKIKRLNTRVIIEAVVVSEGLVEVKI